MPDELVYVDSGHDEFLVFRESAVPEEVRPRLREFTSIEELIIALRAWQVAK
jgi:hypothetical protein